VQNASTRSQRRHDTADSLYNPSEAVWSRWRSLGRRSARRSVVADDQQDRAAARADPRCLVRSGNGTSRRRFRSRSTPAACLGSADDVITPSRTTSAPRGISTRRTARRTSTCARHPRRADRRRLLLAPRRRERLSADRGPPGAPDAAGDVAKSPPSRRSGCSRSRGIPS